MLLVRLFGCGDRPGDEQSDEQHLHIHISDPGISVWANAASKPGAVAKQLQLRREPELGTRVANLYSGRAVCSGETQQAVSTGIQRAAFLYQHVRDRDGLREFCGWDAGVRFWWGWRV